MVVVATLRSGGRYNAGHARWLGEQVKHWLPDMEFWVYTDMQCPGLNAIPLQHGWPGWWAKMEAFAPGFSEQVLHLDLDTVLLGRPGVADAEGSWIPRDWYTGGYRPEVLQSSIVVTTPETRAAIWEDFTKSPEEWRRSYRGDQEYLTGRHSRRFSRIQDAYPDEVVSFKSHVSQWGVLPQMKVVCFHGDPKPWDVKLPWVPPLGQSWFEWFKSQQALPR